MMKLEKANSLWSGHFHNSLCSGHFHKADNYKDIEFTRGGEVPSVQNVK